VDTRANRGQSHLPSAPLPPTVLAVMTKPELRQRRRVGVDTARQQRRGYKAGRRVLKAAEEAANVG
jgi:hypothetical protein